MLKLTKEQAVALNGVLHFPDIEKRLEVANRVFAPWYFQLGSTDVQDRRLAGGPPDDRRPGKRSDGDQP